MLSSGLTEDQYFSLKNLYDQILESSENIKKVDKKLKEQAKIDYKLERIYQSVPGIGPTIARILGNELRDMSQFANERKLFSYTG